MTHTRFSYSKWEAMVIGFLNMFNLVGFCTTTAIVGGQSESPTHSVKSLAHAISLSTTLFVAALSEMISALS